MRLCLVSLMFLSVHAGSVAASTYTVTATSGGGTCTPGSTTDADCTLAAAIDATADGDTIRFAPPVQGQTIVVGSGFPDVLPASVTIDGSPNGVTLDGAASYTIFYIQAGLTVVLSHLTLQNGLGSSGGGAIHTDGNVTIDSCTLNNNAAIDDGGAIYNLSNGTLTITNSTLASNAATVGGAIFNYGTIVISNSTIAGNNASSSGGGIANGGTLTLMSDIVAANVAPNDPDIDAEVAIPVTLGFNLFGTYPGNGPGDFEGDPLLASAGLAGNGGATRTLALQSVSPARGAGNCGGNAGNPAIPAITVDQRGIARGAACTVGAFDMTAVFYAGFEK